MSDDIRRFYRGEAGNIAGNTFDEILLWNNGVLEMDHDYIQWIFPSNEPSMMNADAPVFSREDEKIFKSDPELQKRVFCAYFRMMDFFGYDTNTEEDMAGRLLRVWLEKLEPTDERPNPQNAFDYFNHNMLRVTRILKSLRLMGRDDCAQAFYEVLQEYKPNVSANTWDHWSRAATGDLWSPEATKNKLGGDLGTLTFS